MTWAERQCQHCGKAMPRRMSETEFCSSECAREFLRKLAARRLGIPEGPEAKPSASSATPKRASAKTTHVAKRIRQRVDEASETRRIAALSESVQAAEPDAGQPPLAQSLASIALASPVDKANEPVSLAPAARVPAMPSQTVNIDASDPALVTELQGLTPPGRTTANLHPRGVFPFFPIGDLALLAPVQLPDAVENGPVAAPAPADGLKALNRPELAEATLPLHSGVALAGFNREGRPAGSLPSSQAEIADGAFRNTSLSNLSAPPFVDVATAVARTVEHDQLLITVQQSLPQISSETLNVPAIQHGALNLAVLADPVRQIRNGGAGIVHSAPPRPVVAAGTKPEIVALDGQLAQPAWMRGVPVPMPGLIPKPKDWKPKHRDLAPWFVPARPKAPGLNLQPQETPAGWSSSRAGFVAKPAKLPPGAISTFNLAIQEPATELQALAASLNAEEILPDKVSADSPWPKQRHIPVIGPMADWWMTATNQVRLMVIALPLLVAIALRPMSHAPIGAPTMDERPTAPVRVARTEGSSSPVPAIPSVPKDLEVQVERETKRQFDGFRRAIVSRAAVEMADDFQNGLDNWEANGQLGPSWSYDRTGFIRPRALGIFRPSMELSDYAFEFLGKIDQYALGWVFRASDRNNYYAMKLVDKTGGATPQMALVHWAVIEGREGPKKEVPLPLNVYKDTLFRIRMDIQGPHFSVQVQGTVVDYWKDSRLKAGGVGFFASRGEESRVRWVQVTHQDDVLGKLCAFLAPYAN